MGIGIREGGLDDPRVIALLTVHVTSARAQTAVGSAHALDVSGLRKPEIRFWTAWEDDIVLGTVALKALPDGRGEVKSMHTAETARRRGVGSAMLRHVIGIARAAGMNRLYLETGSWTYFAPARALYAQHGFIECGPFAEYVPDRNSVFMTLGL